jgi:hypothetical protein
MIIKTENDDELEIVKCEYQQVAQEARHSTSVSFGAFARVIAVLKQVAKTAYLKPSAVIKMDKPLSEIYQACGATECQINNDFPVSRFVCLAGETPTFHIARALQEAGGIVRWKDHQLEFMSVPDLFAQDPMEEELSNLVTEEVRSSFLERHDIPFFYSLDRDGEFVYGDRGKPRTARYQPWTPEPSLRNMTKCLILRKSSRIVYNSKLAAGDLLTIHDADPLVIMTIASLFESGSDSGPPMQYSRLWLGGMEAAE